MLRGNTGLILLPDGSHLQLEVTVLIGKLCEEGFRLGLESHLLFNSLLYLVDRLLQLVIDLGVDQVQQPLLAFGHVKEDLVTDIDDLQQFVLLGVAPQRLPLDLDVLSLALL